MGRIWMPGGGGGADLDVITAGAGDVLSGKVIVDQDGNPITGTIPVKNAIASSINCGGSVDIPAGYYPTAGKVQANSLASQTAANAGAGQILSGYSGWVNGAKVNGSMTNRGTWTGTCGTNGSVTIPAGYHNGSGKVTNSQAKQGGQTITPSTSQQTVSCNGKLMTGNIVINAIPSNYVNINSSPAFFSGGSYGKLADLGAYLYKQNGGSPTYTYISASNMANTVSVKSSSGSWEEIIIFKRCIPTSIKRIVAVVNVGGSVYRSTYMMLVKNNYYSSVSRSSEMAGTSSDQTLTVNMESSPDSSAKYALIFRCMLSKSATSSFKVKSIIGYAS